MSLLEAAGRKKPKPPPKKPKPALRAYMVSGLAPEEGACLVFAPTAHLAKVAAWRSPAKDWLLDLAGGEWTELRVKWLQGGADYYRDPQQEEAGLPYVIEAPQICECCELWRESGLEKKTGLCWPCFEDQDEEE